MFTDIMRLTYIIFAVSVFLSILESTEGGRSKSNLYKKCRNLPKKLKRMCIKRIKNKIGNYFSKTCSDCMNTPLKNPCCGVQGP